MNTTNGSNRDLGLDAARGVAIVAMVLAHSVPWYRAPTPVHQLLGQINDLASPLFGLVMGVSAGLVARKVVRRGERRWPTVAHFAVRALLLILVGELLLKINIWIAVVLQPLGLTALVGAFLMFLRPRLLAVLAAVTWFLELVNTQPGEGPGSASWRTPWDWLHVYALSDPHYRLTGLLPLFLLGVVIGRVGHNRPRTLRLTGAVGVLAAIGWVAGKAAQLATPPGRWIDNTHDLALSAIVFAAVCAAVRLPAVAGTFSRALARPVALIGTVSLSVYALQFVLIKLLVQHPPAWLPFGWKPALVFIVGCLALGWLWARLVGTGPLEWLLGRLSGKTVLAQFAGGPISRAPRRMPPATAPPADR